jgi:hypothetical protein
LRLRAMITMSVRRLVGLSHRHTQQANTSHRLV